MKSASIFTHRHGHENTDRGLEQNEQARGQNSADRGYSRANSGVKVSSSNSLSGRLAQAEMTRVSPRR